jgi:uncharacterized protein (TIGR03437 family)
VVGDFNTDGKPDMVVGASDGISLLLGNGSGGFAAATSVLTDVGDLVGLATGDFNNDGKLDLARVTRFSDLVFVLLGDGAGRFGSPVTYNLVPGSGNPGRDVRPTFVAAGDFNDDGRTDLLAIGDGSIVSLLLGQGTGEFRATSLAVTGRVPAVLVVDDFDGDGKLDAANTNTSGTVAILFGDGAGRIGTPNFPLEALPKTITASDFNRDGRIDLAAGNLLSRSISVLFGDGRGSYASTRFGSGTPPANSPGPEFVTSGDLNNDGNPDLAVAGGSEGGLLVYLGNGIGVFATPDSYVVGSFPDSIAIGDLNSDGKPDLVVANRESRNVSVLLGDGMGKFGAAANYAVASRPWSVAVADFNGDGKLDVVTANQDTNDVSVLLNDGTGKLGMAANYAAVNGPGFVATGDFNGDNKPDLAIGSLTSSAVVLLNDGTGKFGVAKTVLPSTSAPSIAVGDFNGDGKTDLAAANTSAFGVSVLLGDGMGSFSASQNFFTGSSPNSIVAADFNGDGKIDLAVANTGSGPSLPGLSNSVSVLLNTCSAMGNLANTSAASFRLGRLAPESIVAAFGTNLASETQMATVLPLPTALAGTSVKVKDSFGDERLAPLFFVSPAQVNYLMPTGTVTGMATITVVRNNVTVAIGSSQISPIAPALFAANANGQGVAAAVLLRVKPDGSQLFDTVSDFDQTRQLFVPLPIDLGPESDQVFLLLFGTGIRGRSSLTKVSVQVGGVNVETLYAGPQGDFAGLDQLNLRLPRTLIGRGEVDLVITVDGLIANAVRLNFK